MAAQERAQAENLMVETNPAGGQEGGVQDQPIVSGEISEVPQEKLKESRRSKKPPRVPVSDGVMPSSEAGASASDTALEQDESQRSATEKEISSEFERWPGSEPSSAAMRTFATKFQGKIDRAKEKIRTLDGNPKKKLVQLAQVEANIEFARILREAPDSFDAEADKAEAWLPNVAGSDVEFDSLFAGLDSDLVISPISSDSSGTARDDVSLETLAADVGVRAFDGSMTDELGMNHDNDEYVNIDD
ncbi:hypothetical protein AALP_AA8G301200 [Arabis alpina]|uniref:Uncharacterized protein n=1 Tax=Arabis alpina TaxID=50452 RepID=A0A087GAE6_ARAAL|nr:hypothetical protein AALP_AA8G301200 [Arabis alpina]